MNWGAKWTAETAIASSNARAARIRAAVKADQEYYEYEHGEWIHPNKRPGGCTCGSCWYRYEDPWYFCFPSRRVHDGVRWELVWQDGNPHAADFPYRLRLTGHRLVLEAAGPLTISCPSAHVARLLLLVHGLEFEDGLLGPPGWLEYFEVEQELSLSTFVSRWDARSGSRSPPVRLAMDLVRRHIEDDPARP